METSFCKPAGVVWPARVVLQAVMMQPAGLVRPTEVGLQAVMVGWGGQLVWCCQLRWSDQLGSATRYIKRMKSLR